MLKKTISVLIILFSFFNASANIKDSVIYYLTSKNPELIGGLSSRTTFIGNHKTSVSGAAIGADYGGKIRFLGGIYGLLNPLEEKKIINTWTPAQDTVLEISRLWYFGFTGVYTFFKQNRWTLEVPVRIGFGSANIEHHETGIGKQLISETTSLVIPLESGIGAQYKIAWWIGISGGLGSRIVIGKNTSQKFSGTYYNLGVTIFFGDIYNHIRDDMKKNPVNRSNRK